VTQLSNPKTAIVYASIFAALLPTSAPAWLFLSLPPLVFALEASWYALVALAFSEHGSQSVYLRSKAWVDRIAGAVMGALGARLLSETVLSRNWLKTS
jgi:threonine/homoserine/homoserine lactone efflux protein